MSREALTSALVGYDRRLRELYYDSAEFHAQIRQLVAWLPALVEAYAVQAEARRAKQYDLLMRNGVVGSGTEPNPGASQ